MSDVREALRNAIQSSAPLEEAPPEAAPLEAAANQDTEAPPVANDDAEAVPSRARDEAGRFAAKGKTGDVSGAVAAAVAAKAPPPEVAKPEAASADVPAAQTAAPEVRAPTTWKPAARELFSKLPPEVQQEVIRRENRIEAAINEAVPARKLQEEFQRLTQPYQQLLGPEPMRAMGNLLQTAAALQTSAPPQKAAILANLIRAYGVPVEALAAALDGAPANTNAQTYAQPQPQFDASTIERLVESKLEAQRNAAAVQAFADGKEFFEEVRGDMAELIASAERHGKTLSLSDAYTRACKLHPEVSEVLQRREADAATVKAQASTQRARLASSSVRSQPAGAVNAAAPKDIRGALEAAIRSSQGR